MMVDDGDDEALGQDNAASFAAHGTNQVGRHWVGFAIHVPLGRFAPS